MRAGRSFIGTSPETTTYLPTYLIQRAWESQYLDLPPREGRADVDLEALEVLEQQLFEVSEAGGDANYYKWGLDVGHHQEDRYPVHNI